MRLRPWAAIWAGITVLAACAQEQGPLEQESSDLDARIEKAAQIVAELEQAAAHDSATIGAAGGQ